MRLMLKYALAWLDRRVPKYERSSPSGSDVPSSVISRSCLALALYQLCRSKGFLVWTRDNGVLAISEHLGTLQKSSIVEFYAIGFAKGGLYTWKSFPISSFLLPSGARFLTIAAHSTPRFWSASTICGYRTQRESQIPTSRVGKVLTIFRACHNSRICACDSCRSVRESVNHNTSSLIWGLICRRGSTSIRPAHPTRFITMRIVTSAEFITLASKRPNVATSFSGTLELLPGCSHTLRLGQQTSLLKKLG